jgi:phage/plasmid-associated DNA primase
MMEGCREWWEHRLKPPPALCEATAAYLEEEDAIARWIKEECAVDPIYFGTVAGLFAS